MPEKGSNKKYPANKWQEFIDTDDKSHFVRIGKYEITTSATPRDNFDFFEIYTKDRGYEFINVQK